MILLTLRYFIGFRSSVVDVGQSNNGGFKVD